jgi:putative FmdB family regulatory protein
MPLYEYACRSCGHRFERRLRFEERLQTQTCPACQHTETVLCLSAPSFIGASAKTDGPTCPGTGGPCGCGRFDN